MENRSLVVGYHAHVVGGRLHKEDGSLSARAGPSGRLSLAEPIPELRRKTSPPDRHHREGTPPSHDFR